MKKSWKIVAVALAVTLALGAVGVGVAVADDPDEPVERGRLGLMGLAPLQGMYGRYLVLDEVADLLDMTPRELLEELGDGATIADLAEERGVALDDLVDAMVAETVDRNADLVEQGLLTQDQADARVAAARERAMDVLELPFPEGMHGKALRAAAEAIGISVDELIERVQEGETIAEVAEAEGATVEDVVEAITQARSRAHQEMIGLDLMTETQSGLALHRCRQAAERFVEETPGQGPPAGRRPVRRAVGTIGRGEGGRGRRFMVIWR